MDLISRQEAIAQGLVRYFTGNPCSKGHISERRVIGSSCLECNNLLRGKNKHYLTPGAKATASAYRKNNPKIGLLERARNRAKVKGLDFDLSIEDIIIPEFCPILGIPLFHNEGGHPSPNSPSLDRIIPSLGYVKGNVCIISHRANTIKNDASVDELLSVARYIQDHLLRNSTVLQ